jgi:hydroxyacylglutathione hydrolase
MIIKQLEVGYRDNFCYIVGCEDTRQAMVIDPGSDVERILSEADKADLNIVTIVNTHGHGDHTAGNTKLKALAGHNYGPTPSSTIHWEKRDNVNAREYGYHEEKL